MEQQNLFGGSNGRRKPATLDERFKLWVSDNPGTVELFLRFAQQAKRSGRNKLGIGALAERVRWEVYIERDEAEEYKINNSYRSRLARLLVERDPSLSGMFEFRRLISK